MNQLIAMSSEMTMGTREIAEMLGARHADIIKSVCRLHDAGAICHDTTLPFREFKTERGNTYIEYMLNKLDSITLVAQNSPQFTAACGRVDALRLGINLGLKVCAHWWLDTRRSHDQLRCGM